jgi:hypothetical protein
MSQSKRVVSGRAIIEDFLFFRVRPPAPPPARKFSGCVGQYGQAIGDMEAVEEEVKELVREARRTLVWGRLP